MTFRQSPRGLSARPRNSIGKIPRTSKFGIIHAGLSRLVLGIALAAVGCHGGSARSGLPTVVVYSALDEEYAKPILTTLDDELGLNILAKYDVESTKTVGLTNQIIAEAIRPRCGLFWNNEILNTLRLKERGLLLPFEPSNAKDLPTPFRDPDRCWYGFAARARILLVNTKLVSAADMPKGLADLTSSKWKGRIGVAKPLFGTTATHAACLAAAWGEERAEKYFKDLKANGVQILSGNKQVARSVGSGEIAFGLTDTDDAVAELTAGNAVSIVYPDRNEGELGTLFIPNTLALIKGSPNRDEARRLADRILSREIEARLAAGPSAQIPLLKGTPPSPRIETPATVKAMDVDFGAAAKGWDRIARFLADEFAG